MGRLIGKVAIVSGSGRGIGRSIALKLASEGAKVVINDIDIEPATNVAQEINSLGGRAIVCVGNVVEAGFAEQFVSTAVDNFGSLDIIINNAGYTWDNVIQKMTDEQWYAMIDCHMTAPFRILRAAYPIMREQSNQEQKNGRRIVRKVINISSVSGMFGNVGQINYSAAKAGVLGMTKTLAKEWGRLAVTVNAVAYGLIKTRLTGDVSDASTANIGGIDIKVGVNHDLLVSMENTIPLGRAGTPDEAADAVFYSAFLSLTTLVDKRLCVRAV